ncbi:Uncharacterised protein g567 [Pycnogonum litorale]
MANERLVGLARTTLILTVICLTLTYIRASPLKQDGRSRENGRSVEKLERRRKAKMLMQIENAKDEEFERIRKSRQITSLNVSPASFTVATIFRLFFIKIPFKNLGQLY